MKLEVGDGDLSSVPELKSLWLFHGCGTGDQGAPELGVLIALNYEGLQEWSKP